MKNRNSKILFLLATISLLPTIVWGMMAVGSPAHAVTMESSSVTSAQDTIFLLSWDDNFLQTSKGALSTIGVKIVDHANIDRKELPRLTKMPIVKFVTKNNQVIQVDIYPPR